MDFDLSTFRVRAVYDTRQKNFVDGKWRAISGTGESHACGLCGRAHEVWAVLEQLARDNANCAIKGPDGKFVVTATATVGVQCAKRAGFSYGLERSSWRGRPAVRKP